MNKWLLKSVWLFSLPLLLVVLPQAYFVRRSTPRMQEATGPRKRIKTKSALNLLHLGESTVAGVGVDHISEGFTVQVVQELVNNLNQQVNWEVLGVNGICMKDLLNELRQSTSIDHDLAIVTMGVNDTTGLTPLYQWRRQLIEMIFLLKKNGVNKIFFTHVPPVEQFPVLPVPLNYFLGIRAQLLDLEVKHVCELHTDVEYLGTELKIERQMIAEDGYHPSALGYRHWAKRLTPTLIKKMLKLKKPKHLKQQSN